MRIHSDTLTAEDISEATHARGMRGVFPEIAVKGSQKRTRRFDVRLTGSGQLPISIVTAGPSGAFITHNAKVATWDEWGMYIDALYQIDPEAIIGPYKGREDFRTSTYKRFDTLTAPFQHEKHAWRFAGDGEQICADCEAKRSD